jgi:hypothetical protein
MRSPTFDAAATSDRPPITPPSVASCIDVTPRSRRPNSDATRASGTTVISSKSASAAPATSPPTPSASRWGNVAANNAVASIAAPLVTTTRSPGCAIAGVTNASAEPDAMHVAPPTIGHAHPS